MSFYRASRAPGALRAVSGSVAAAAALVLALVLASGCGGGDEAKPVAKPVAPSKPMAPAPSQPATTPPPAETVEVVEVETIELGDATAGAKHYASLCASCHGARGAGDGPVSAGLNPKPAAHTDGAYMNALSNEHLFLVIKNGGTAVGKSALMAPWGSMLSDDQIRDVVAFVRSLAEPPYTGP